MKGFVILFFTTLTLAAELPRNLVQTIERGSLPTRVHVFEDYETEIEKRWWLRGTPVADGLGESLSPSISNSRACRAAETKDFDDKQGDPAATWKAVIFNPVPGPPMSGNTRLSFRYKLAGSDTMRVQIYSLSNGYHRNLSLTGLPQGSWQSATVDMTKARRPDGTGGPLAADERIDDIQFYVAPDADLLIDDIVLYEAAGAGEKSPFPKRVIFTGWFDTGKQGEEWPGDFEIVKHDAPLTWKCAKSVPDAANDASWLRIGLRGARPLGETTRLRFRYRLTGTGPVKIALANSKSQQDWNTALVDAGAGAWMETVVDFAVGTKGASADELRFLIPKATVLLVDDVLLYEP